MTSWIDVNEKLPEYEELILGYCPHFKANTEVALLRRTNLNPGDMWRDTEGLYYGASLVTHWMSLPATPGKENKEKP